MNQIQIPWISLRSGVVADDVALTTFDYASWPDSGTIAISANEVSNVVHLLDARRWWIGFYGKDAQNEDCAYRLYGRARTNGPILLLAEGLVTLGSQAVTADPITKEAVTAYWADSITITGGLWADMAPLVLDSGNNRIAFLRGRNDGLRDLYCEFDLDGGSAAVTEMNAVIRGCEDV